MPCLRVSLWYIQLFARWSLTVNCWDCHLDTHRRLMKRLWSSRLFFLGKGLIHCFCSPCCTTVTSSLPRMLQLESFHFLWCIFFFSSSCLCSRTRIYAIKLLRSSCCLHCFSSTLRFICFECSLEHRHLILNKFLLSKLNSSFIWIFIQDPASPQCFVNLLRLFSWLILQTPTDQICLK